MSRTAIIAAAIIRLVAGAFFVLTALYALLVYLPLTHQQLILPKILPWLSSLVAWHRFLFAGAIVAIAAASIDDLRNAATRRRTAVFLAAGLVAAIYFIARPLLPDLRPDRSSLVASLLCLVPVLWMAALDALSARGRIAWREPDQGEDRRTFDTAVCTAMFVALIYFGIAAARPGPAADATAAAGARLLLIALVWSVTAHLLLFGALFLALLAIRGAARLAGGSAVHETMLLFVLATALGTLVFKTIVFAAVSFTGPASTAVAVAFALSVAGLLAGLIVRLQPLSGRPIRSGLDLLAAPFAWLRASGSAWWLRVAALTSIAAAAWWLSASTSMMDWNYLLQKLSAIAIWIVAFAAIYAMRDGVSRPAIVWLLLGAAIPAIAHRALGAIEDRVPRWIGLPGVDVRSVLDRHAGLDASFKVIHDAASSGATGDERRFYDLLERNTNIPREVRVDPVEVNLVESLAPTSAHTPNIFLFVIDSLRQDYVSPYNPRVTFTPAIEAFARDSVVFTRAITRYGATGLSEPSIWVGGMMVHKHYVMPFAPMNALDKLLAADGYQRFLSRDVVLRTIMPDEDTSADLDVGVLDMDYDLCRTLTELQGKLRGRSRTGRPVFAYTQPQNIHISRMTREGVTPGAAPSGFYPPYATRIQRMDACFGAFVQFLRDEGLYDDSLIVLTADHGDSLGEGGRWGHAYTLFPEIIRIPLIVHLPAAWRAQVTCDSDAVASLVDITPTLYYLLGHRPVVSDAVFGRPLCTATAPERIATRRDSYMVVSSYGPVYGIVQGNGRWLYIADAVNYTDYYYDMTADPAGAQNLVTPAVRREYQRLIREGLDGLNRFYFPGTPRAP